MDFKPPMFEYSVIIPVLNDAAAADQCVERLCKEHRPDIEVIVVDGGSLDDTRERIQTKYPAAHLLEAAPGRGSQMNLGAEAARGRVLVFLHADCVLPPDWKEALDEAFARRNTCLTAFKLRFAAPEFKYRILEACVDLRSLLFRLPYGDQAYAVTQDTFTQLNGFHDQALMEDVDFLRRARKLGRIRMLRSRIFSSTRNWRQDGFIKRCRINLATLVQYARGSSANELAHHYQGRKNAVLVFCKKPEPGKVKTRLAAGIGKAAAAAFYSDMVEKTLRSLQRRVRPYQIIVCFDPPEEYEYFVNWLGPRSAYLPQMGSDLGERMAGAVRTAEAIGYTDLVLIGTDCPGLAPRHIDSTLEFLKTCDVVIGPAVDGGYYLLAFHSGCADLFDGIAWSTAQVLDQTLEKAVSAGLQVRQLEPLQDVDTAQDLNRI